MFCRWYGQKIINVNFINTFWEKRAGFISISFRLWTFKHSNLKQCYHSEVHHERLHDFRSLPHLPALLIPLPTSSTLCACLHVFRPRRSGQQFQYSRPAPDLSCLLWESLPPVSLFTNHASFTAPTPAQQPCYASCRRCSATYWPPPRVFTLMTLAPSIAPANSSCILASRPQKFYLHYVRSQERQPHVFLTQEPRT